MSLLDTRAVMVCVDFADILRLTLPWNMPQLHSILVVTHPRDHETVAVAQEFGADVLLTTVFYEREAVFNKFHALELGLDYIGRDSWIAIMDCDVFLPRNMRPFVKNPGSLYLPRRRMLPAIPLSVEKVPEERKWRQYKYQIPRDLINGHCQIFHASDPALGPAPWHATNWKWCSGPEGVFQGKWSDRNKVRPNFEVLHIGEPQVNWAGRAAAYADGSIPENAAKNKDMVKVLLRSRKEFKRQLTDKHDRERIIEDVHPSPV